jgi:integrase
MKVKFKHLVQDLDRHGNVRVYVRVNGRKVRIRESVGTPKFLALYGAAVDALKSGVEPPRPKEEKIVKKETFGWLVKEHAKSPVHLALNARSQRVRLQILEQCLAEPVSPESPYLFRDCPVDQITPKAIKVLRDRKGNKPGASANRMKALSVLFKWAFEAEHIASNPYAGVSKLKYEKKEFVSWTQEEVAQFTERHPIGTKPHLALAIMLFTGVRRSDAVKLGPEHVKNGYLCFKTTKTGTALELPILPELRAVLDKTRLGKVAFLETDRRKPFTEAGFGNWFRDRCDEAGLPERTAHGLRKSGAVIAAQNGATEKQMMAIFGWDTAAMAAHYSKAAQQKKLAKAAMHLIVHIPTSN